jgi:hypothetical protein
MCTGNPVIHHESGTARRNKPGRSQRPRCVFSSKEPRPNHQMTVGDGVSTYLALIFGTLLSSQGTDASFVLTLSGFPPGFSLRSCVSDSIRPFPVPISSVLSRFPLPRFPFQRFRLYQKFRTGLTGRSFPIHRECGFSEIEVSRSRQTLTVADRIRSSSRQLFESTSPTGPCQRLLWGEEETSSSAGVTAHKAAVGTTELRSAASTSPVSPARTARPPRT